jgi:hypothetical protein
MTSPHQGSNALLRVGRGAMSTAAASLTNLPRLPIRNVPGTGIGLPTTPVATSHLGTLNPPAPILIGSVAKPSVVIHPAAITTNSGKPCSSGYLQLED